VEFAAFEEEAQWVAGEIERLHEAGAPWRSFAVLYRKHTHRAQLVPALRRQGIPFVIRKASILDNTLVRDLLAWLRLIAVPADNVACARVLAAPYWGLEPRDLEAREGLRETDKKDTRLFVQTHPDVLVIPPDPPQMMIKVDQVRRVIETIYYRPGEARERVYIFTKSSFMKEAANSLLKVLEEPPEFATIFLLTENPGELLPTIRSRAMIITLAALPAEEIERDLAKYRPEWAPRQRRWRRVPERRAAPRGRDRTIPCGQT